MPDAYNEFVQLMNDAFTPEQQERLFVKIRDARHPIHAQAQGLQRNTQQLMDSPQVLERVQRQDPRPAFQEVGLIRAAVEGVMDLHQQAKQHDQAGEHMQAAHCYTQAVQTVRRGPIGTQGSQDIERMLRDAAEHARQHPELVGAEQERSQRGAMERVVETLGADHRTSGAAYEAAAATTGALAQRQRDMQMARQACEYLARADQAYSKPTHDLAQLHQDHTRLHALREASTQRYAEWVREQHQQHQDQDQDQDQSYDGPDH